MMTSPPSRESVTFAAGFFGGACRFEGGLEGRFFALAFSFVFDLAGMVATVTTVVNHRRCGEPEPVVRTPIDSWVLARHHGRMNESGPSLAWVSGVVVAVAVAALVGGGGGVLWAKRVAARAERGWSLVPAAVGVRDVPAGTTVSSATLTLSDTPEPFVTSNTKTVVVTGRTLVAELGANETLLEQHFSRASPGLCAKYLRGVAADAGLDGEEHVQAALAGLEDGGSP